MKCQTHMLKVWQTLCTFWFLLFCPCHSLIKNQISNWTFLLSRLCGVGSPSVLPMNTQDWSPLGWTGWTSLQAKGHSRVFSNTTVQKHQFFSTQLSRSPDLLVIWKVKQTKDVTKAHYLSPKAPCAFTWIFYKN